MHGPKHRPSSNTVFAGGRQSHPKPTKKASPKKKHVVHKAKTSSNKSWSFLPQAHASSTPSTAGKFNPPGWTGQQDYGTPRWHKSQKGELGKAIASSKKQHPQAWMTATGPKGLQQPQQSGIHTMSHTPTPAPTTTKQAGYRGTTIYATQPDGHTFKIQRKLSLQDRQYYREHGVKLSTRKPSTVRKQQELSDVFGVTTFTTLGHESTTPRDLSAQTMTKTRKEQQKLSDKYGITTYNKDGSVSTIPREQQQQEQQQQSKGAWWWDSPFTVSAEKDKKEKPWGWW